MTPVPELEKGILAGIARIAVEVEQTKNLGDREPSMRDLWQVFSVLIESPEYDYTVNDLLQECFKSEPNLARAISILHNKHAESLKLQGPTNTIQLAPHTSRPNMISDSSTATPKLPELLQQPQSTEPIQDGKIKNSYDEENNIHPSETSHEHDRSETSAVGNGDVNINGFLRVVFQPQPAEFSQITNTVPFKVVTDPDFQEVLPGLIQCYMRLLDAKFSQEEGTSAKHLEAIAAMLKDAGDLSINFPVTPVPITDYSKKLEAIVDSAISLSRTFCLECAAKPSNWSGKSLVKRRQFCQQALDFARDALSLSEEMLKSQTEKGFGVAGARGEKRSLEDDEDNESGNEAGSKRRRMESPPHPRAVLK